jgi:hypothetical protein
MSLNQRFAFARITRQFASLLPSFSLKGICWRGVKWENANDIRDDRSSPWCDTSANSDTSHMHADTMGGHARGLLLLAFIVDNFSFFIFDSTYVAGWYCCRVCAPAVDVLWCEYLCGGLSSPGDTTTIVAGLLSFAAHGTAYRDNEKHSFTFYTNAKTT